MGRKGGGSGGGKAADPCNGVLHCPLCHTDHESPQSFAQHKATEQHAATFLRHWYQINKISLTRNKNGVVISVDDADRIMFDEDTGIVSISVTPGEQRSFEMYITNTGKSPVILYKMGLLHDCDAASLLDQYGVARGEKAARLNPGMEYMVECQIQMDSFGVEQVPVAFQLHFEFSSQIFYIVRILQINGIDEIGLESGPKSVYRKQDQGSYSFRDFEGYIPGIEMRSEYDNKLPNAIPLKEFKYTESLKKIVEHNFNPTTLKRVYGETFHEALSIKKMQNNGLKISNHTKWFKTLLWTEEMQMEIDIAFYNMNNARLKRVPKMNYSLVDCVELEVPGLAEKRPSILKGDSVYITYEGSYAKGYEGIVHQVNEKTIYLALSSQFMGDFINNMKVEVQFSFGRLPLKVGHRALELAEQRKLMNFVFPSSPTSDMSLLQQTILPFNRKLEDNPEQLEAVRNIVCGASRPAPYIVFGPPGTGKTVTIVEAIKQIYKHEPKSRVLVCAPSNAACDNITARMLEHISRNHIFRMYSASRLAESIPEKIRPVSNFSGNAVSFPSVTELMEYRVIVCTMVTAAKIVTAGLPKKSMSHVFLEECGQATEPEALVGVAGILQSDGQLVLAGDPYQLGPVIRNYLCYSQTFAFKENGLDKSYLERLMEMDMYQPTPENCRVVTKLLKNYRSQKDILKLPNEMFYKSELKVCADPVYVESLCMWEHLPKKNFPLIFHGVKGKDEREGKSPSFFNALEVSTVIDYVQKLLKTRVKVLGKDIGIITPYRQQVTKIRMQINKIRDASEIKVGSPEEFQGDERRVIIISTVRANVDKLAYDLTYQLGFLQNPKRFNVSVTRAKALLIIVGCPEILSLDEHWGKLLDFIRGSGGYCGKPYYPDINKEFDKSIIQKFNQLDLNKAAVDDRGARMKAEHPAWSEA